MKFRIVVYVIAIIFIFGGVKSALAGFGVSPPTVWNDHLVPGAHFEQIIYLVRGTPDKDLDATVTIEAPEIEDWIKVEQGNSFTLPQGIQQFPMKVIVDVPKDAGYGLYEGLMRVRIKPKMQEGGMQVATAMGSRISLKLWVTDEEYTDFKLRGLFVPALEEDWPIKVEVELENLGNVKARPSQVKISIFNKHDAELKHPLKDIQKTSQMTFVEPFTVGKSIAKFEHDLKPDEYWVEITVFKEGNSILKDKVYFKVHEKWGIVPKPLMTRITEYITASILRIMLFTIIGTLLIVGIIIGGILFWKKRKKKFKKEQLGNEQEEEQVDDVEEE